DKTGLEPLASLLQSMGVRSMNHLDKLETLHKIVLAVEAKAAMLSQRQGLQCAFTQKLGRKIRQTPSVFLPDPSCLESVNTGVFDVMYLARLPTSRILARNSFRLAASDAGIRPVANLKFPSGIPEACWMSN